MSFLFVPTLKFMNGIIVSFVGNVMNTRILNFGPVLAENIIIAKEMIKTGLRRISHFVLSYIPALVCFLCLIGTNWI